MDKPRYFLHVEDDPLDAEYVETQLAESGVRCEIRRVDSAEDYRQALEQRVPDLILCDYNLPGFDGMEALRIARELPQAVPFIFLSGGIGEHLAVECLHRGATDYVLKGNPARLVPAILRALEEADVKRAKELAERELAHGEKMALLGQLSAGIAHEINNPVTYINLNMETLKEYAEKILRLHRIFRELMAGAEDPGSPEGRRNWEELRKMAANPDIARMLEDLGNLASETLDGGRRVADITQRLRRFTRQERQEPVEVNLAECMESALRIGWNELKGKATVHRRFPDRLPRVRGNANQLTQVFLNLLVNAAQALPGRGEITVEILEREGRVLVRVSDTGRGIEPADMERIFTPFFTTKTAGEGTGLGLYVSKGIVENHGGTLAAENLAGGGAMFTVDLPAAGKEE